MEVKNILKKITHQEEEKKELYFAFEITEALVKTALWTISGGDIQVLSVGVTKKITEETLLEMIDVSLSSATASMPPELQETEPSQVIFGLPLSWVEEDRIMSTKTPLLKNIVEKFELTPMGFVVIPEAIIHYLKNSEGLPPTAILIGLEKETATITLVSLGRIIGSQIVRRSGNLGSDLIEGLSRLETNESYPSRIMLYDGLEDLEAAKQELTVFPFQETSINFLHLPKVESLPVETDIQAVALAGGQEYAKNKGVEATSVTAVVNPPVEENFYTEEVAEESVEGVEAEEELEKEPLISREEVMGFVQDRDVTLSNPLPTPELVAPEPISMNFGSLSAKIKPLFLKKTRLVSGEGTSFKHFPISKFIVAALLVLIVIGGAGYGVLWYFPHAQVTIFVAPRDVAESLEIKVDPKQSAVDIEELVLPGEKVETSVESEKSFATTGTKKVGEASRGEVTIYNGTSKEKTFAAGTELTSTSGLKFTFDGSVTVASQSGTAASPTPGRATVKVTAGQIGAEGNLAAESEFSIGSFTKSDYVAKSSSAFTGGSSREVQVVAETDREKLLDSLMEDLSGQASDKLNGQLPDGRKIIPDSITKEILSKEFDSEVGKETTEIKGKLKMGFAALSYAESDIEDLVKAVVEKKIPEGFEYRPGNNDADFTFKDLSKTGVATFALKINTSLSPTVQPEEIRQNLKGKSVEAGTQYLKNLANIGSFEAKITPNLPLILASFPRVLKNISVIVEAK